ncbi:MAG: FHA domain-containing protein [Pseudomonadales bacterium]
MISNDLKIFIELDGDSIPLQESMTIGRQLDNDLVVAGEDVLDFHLRLEPTERGAKAFPLGEASLTINDDDWAEPVELMAGDSLNVGHSEILVIAEPVPPPQADEWWLHADREESIYKITGTLVAGRGDDNEILLLDDHISRKHAELSLRDGVVWLKDLRSANGTFVNGNRLVGGCRLYHGDEVGFDTLRFQLVGRGQDLTPVRPPDSPTEVVLIKDVPASTLDTTEFSLADPQSEAPLVVPESSETGAFLLGVSEPISGYTFRTRIGTTSIGREEDCDVVIRDTSVSARHAEIVVRPETTTITNLMATNGTRINGQQIQNSELADGDIIRIGRVSLVFKDVPATEAQRPWMQRLKWLLIGASVILALGLALNWILS